MLPVAERLVLVWMRDNRSLYKNQPNTVATNAFIERSPDVMQDGMVLFMMRLV
jgi:hypothetical protein